MVYILQKSKMGKQGIFEVECILLASSKSHSLIVPLAAPAATKTSEPSKLTDSTALVCPDKLCKIMGQEVKACYSKSKCLYLKKVTFNNVSTHQYRIGLADGPQIDFVILTTSDKNPRSFPTNFEAINI